MKDFYKTITKPRASLGLLAILTLHVIGVEFGLYKSIAWYDVPMHFFGGAWLAFLLSSWSNFEKYQQNKFAAIAVFIMLVGAVWEIYELIFDTYFEFRPKIDMDKAYIADTLKDLAMNFIGGAAFYYFKYGRARA
jgi:hypothetical protein